MDSFYPAFLNLQGRTVLVVGAGEVAARKAEALVRCGADVRVVAPAGSAEMEGLARLEQIAWERREYRSQDLDGAFLVVGSTDRPEVNRQVFEDAQSRQMPCNIVDVPELCSFIVPSILTRGDLTVAVSTGGRSPSFARHVRLWLESLIGPEYGDAVTLLGDLRPLVRERVPTERGRARVYQLILESNLLELLRQGRRQEARETALECLPAPNTGGSE